MTNKLIPLTCADIAGEYIFDFVAGRPFSIFSINIKYKLSNMNID